MLEYRLFCEDMVLMQLPITAGAVSSAGTDVGRDSLETSGNRVLDIMCLRGMNGMN